MTLEQLTHFLAVVKHGSYIAAAQSMDLHPSTISKSISALEKELGGRVFQKRKGVLHLTDAGHFLTSEGAAVLIRFNGLSEQAKRLTGTAGGALSVVTSPHLYATLTKSYRRYNRHYPGVDWTALHVPGTSFREVMDMVLNGTADFGLVPTVELLDQSPELLQLTFYTCPFVLVVGLDHFLADRKSVRLEELAGMKLLMNHALRPDVLVHLSCVLVNQGCPPLEWTYLDQDPNSKTTDDFFFMQVAAGQGAAIAARIVAESHLQNCRLLKIEDFDETVAPFHVSLIWREGNRNPALLRFIELAVAQE